MNARTLSAGLAGVVLISLAQGCERGTPVSRMVASKAAGSSPSFSASASNHGMRWDIIDVKFATGTASAGGIASARANDGSKITLTGSGTFRSNPGNPQDATGGGTWQTFDAGGGSTGSGSYTVTGLVSYTLAPGTPPLPHDNIGNLADNRAGLLVVSISYDDAHHQQARAIVGQVADVVMRQGRCARSQRIAHEAHRPCRMTTSATWPTIARACWW